MAGTVTLHSRSPSQCMKGHPSDKAKSWSAAPWPSPTPPSIAPSVGPLLRPTVCALDVQALTVVWPPGVENDVKVVLCPSHVAETGPGRWVRQNVGRARIIRSEGAGKESGAILTQVGRHDCCVHKTSKALYLFDSTASRKQEGHQQLIWLMVKVGVVAGCGWPTTYDSAIHTDIFGMRAPCNIRYVVLPHTTYNIYVACGTGWGMLLAKQLQ